MYDFVSISKHSQRNVILTLVSCDAFVFCVCLSGSLCTIEKITCFKETMKFIYCSVGICFFCDDDRSDFSVKSG